MKRVAVCPICKAHLVPKLSSKPHRRCPRCKTLLQASEKSDRFANRLLAILIVTIFPTAAVVCQRVADSPIGALAGIPVGFIFLFILAFCLEPYITEYEQVKDTRVCFTCGYNLTGNTSGTCPECGMPVVRKART